MDILVTGAKGFIGQNLIAELKNHANLNVLEFDKDRSTEILNAYCRTADFVFHLAGVNRPDDQAEFTKGNFGFTSELLKFLKNNNNKCPVMLASSIQAALDNPYGVSKKAGEDLLFEYAEETGAPALVYRFPNVFGKWCRPNYNSAVATFCHNIARGLPIQVNDRNAAMTLVYIDDLVKELLNALNDKANEAVNFCSVPVEHRVKLGCIVDLLYSFKESRNTLTLPCLGDAFTKKLYSTYLSYLPKDQFNYSLKINADERGSFTEFIRTEDQGQISVSVSKPGITKGNHWHHTKSEKFLVVSGQGIIRFRKIFSDEVIEYPVSGDKLEVVDIPPGYTHNIENMGDTDMVTVMWANELYDPEKPDTYYSEV